MATFVLKFQDIIDFSLQSSVLENTPKRPTTRFCTRNYSDINKARFIDLIRSQNWDAVLTDSDAQSAYNALLSSVLRHYDAAFPMTEKIRSKRPGWRLSLRELSDKNSLYRRYKSRPTVFNEITYKNIRNRVRREIVTVN